jgi:glutaredoxin
MKPILALLCLTAACTMSSGTDQVVAKIEREARENPVAETPPPSPAVVTDSAEKIVFSWYEPGRGHSTGTTAAEVPPCCRKDVVVADLSRTPDERQASRYVMTVDLTTANAEGRYPVAVQSRYRFNDNDLEDLGPVPKSTGVTVYVTSWCGYCKKVKAMLEARGTPFASKDIENDPAAAKEMAAKLSGQGMRPGGVPVTDVAGTMIKGFNEPALLAALKKAGL